MLNKTPISISFAKGLQTKVDPFRLSIGDFLSLQNTVFDIEGLLKKRNGYGSLSPLPDTSYSYACTFNGNLTAIGSNLAAYSSGSNTWVQKGSIQPVNLNTTTLIRNNTNQSTCDAVVTLGNLVCTVYTDQDPTNLGSKIYRYAVADATTGQNLVAPTTLSATGGPKVFLLGNQFVIVYPNSAALDFLAINISTLVAGSPVTISSLYTSGRPFDAIVANGSLYVSWSYATTPAVKVAFVDSTLLVHTAVSFNTYDASCISVTADNSGTTPVIWVSWFYGGSSLGYSLAINPALVTILGPTEIISSGQVISITSVATGGACSFFYQELNTYSYSSTIRSDYIIKNTITASGTVGTAATLLRSVGLASKAFYIGTTTYMLAVYGANTNASPSFQPTYFLIDSLGNICLKLAYSNGGGYLGALLPNATVSGSTVYFPYLYKDLIVPVNKDRLAPSNDATYSQTGINLAEVTFTAKVLNTAEIGSDLHLTGGFLWMYDGYTPVEHNFHLWPEDLQITGAPASGNMTVQEYFYCATYEWSDNQGNLFRSAPSIQIPYTIVAAPGSSFTANRTSGSPTLASVSSFTSLQVGQAIAGTGIPASTYITALNVGASTLTMSNSASSGSATSTTITAAATTAALIDVPTLRLTYKTANPVKIVLYRWSTAQQTFYQTTSISSPILNSTTVDSVAITDTNGDADILGNSILYTTGGVVENIGAPPTNSVTLFKSRLFLIDSEDKNLLWFSKQVIEATPVEMSDLFTIYVAPTVSAQGSTGPMRCLAALDDKLIIFKDDAIYYITGTGPDNTGANNDFSDPIFITSTVGCANQNSIAFIPDGLMFQSDKGIWLLGRDLSTKYIGAPVQAFNQYAVLSAITIPETNQIRFTLSNGVTLMYDYFFGQWGEFVGVPSVSSTLFQSLHTFINSFGAVFQESPGNYLDGGNPVLISFLTGWINLGGLQGYQRAYLFYLLGTYLSPHKLTLQIAYDYNPSPLQTSIISPDNYSGTYGTVPGAYGGQSPYGGAPALEQWKVDLQVQTCQSFQISLTESFDSFFNTTPGAGLTLSGLDLLVGVKRGFKPIRAANTVG